MHEPKQIREIDPEFHEFLTRTFDVDMKDGYAYVADGENGLKIVDVGIDRDEDGLSDGSELNIYFTDPDNPDSDGDGANDGYEIAEETDPNDSSDTPPLETSTEETDPTNNSDFTHEPKNVIKIPSYPFVTFGSFLLIGIILLVYKQKR